MTHESCGVILSTSSTSQSAMSCARRLVFVTASSSIPMLHQLVPMMDPIRLLRLAALLEL